MTSAETQLAARVSDLLNEIAQLEALPRWRIRARRERLRSISRRCVLAAVALYELARRRGNTNDYLAGRWPRPL